MHLVKTSQFVQRVLLVPSQGKASSLDSSSMSLNDITTLGAAVVWECVCRRQEAGLGVWSSTSCVLWVNCFTSLSFSFLSYRIIVRTKRKWIHTKQLGRYLVQSGKSSTTIARKWEVLHFAFSWLKFDSICLLLIRKNKDFIYFYTFYYTFPLLLLISLFH